MYAPRGSCRELRAPCSKYFTFFLLFGVRCFVVAEETAALLLNLVRCLVFLQFSGGGQEPGAGTATGFGPTNKRVFAALVETGVLW